MSRPRGAGDTLAFLRSRSLDPSKLEVPAGAGGCPTSKHHRNLSPYLLDRCFSLAIHVGIRYVGDNIRNAQVFELPEDSEDYRGMRSIYASGATYLTLGFKQSDADSVPAKHVQ